MGFLKRQLNKILIGLTVSFAISFIAGAIFCNRYIDKNFLKQMHADHASLKLLIPKVIKDLKIIDQNPPFPTWERNKNAEDFFTKNIGWEGEGFTELRTQSHVFLRSLFSDHPNWHKDLTNFNNLISNPLLNQIETNWVYGALSFDHLNITANPTIQKEFQKANKSNGIERISIFAKLPLPNFTDLRRWAVVHVIKEHQAGRAEAGLKVYRHLAFMAHSSSVLVGSMIAAKMLEDEKTLVQFLNIPDWRPVSDNITAAYKRVSWTWPGLLRLPFFNEAPVELEPYLKPQMGLCGGASESVMTSPLILQDFLKPHILFERDFSMELARLSLFQKKILQICDIKAYEALINDVPAEANPLFNKTYETEGQIVNLPINIARVPFVRKVYAMILMSIATPSFDKYYVSESE